MTSANRLWVYILESVTIPQIPLFQSRERRPVAVGLARLLTASEAMLVPPAVKASWVFAIVALTPSLMNRRPTALIALLQLLSVHDTAVQISEPTAAEEELSSIDYEEQIAGHQVAYTSRSCNCGRGPCGLCSRCRHFCAGAASVSECRPSC